MSVDTDVEDVVLAAASRARVAARELALASRAAKDAGLHAMAEALVTATPQILGANTRDVSDARSADVAEAIIDRLRLDESRVAAMADGLRGVAALPDPVGEVVRGSTLAN